MRWCQIAQNIGLSNHKLESVLTYTVRSQCTPVSDRQTDEHRGNAIARRRIIVRRFVLTKTSHAKNTSLLMSSTFLKILETSIKSVAFSHIFSQASSPAYIALLLRTLQCAVYWSRFDKRQPIAMKFGRVEPSQKTPASYAISTMNAGVATNKDELIAKCFCGLPICPSHVAIVSKRMNIGSYRLHWRVVHAH